MVRALVIGAGGFVGGAIFRAVAATPGLTAIAGLRRAPRGSGTIEHRICDIRDRASLERAMAGIDVVVNAVFGGRAAMVAGTHNLCVAATAARIRRILHISTMSVYGPQEGLLAEDAPLAALPQGYPGAKLAGEMIIQDWMARPGNDAVILRPGIVYGPGGQQWVSRIGRLLTAGRLGDLGPAGDGFCNLIHADDVGAAAVAAIVKPEAANQAFNLASPSPLRWNEFLMSFGCAIGAVPVRRISARRLRIETRLAAPPLQVLKLAGLRLGLKPGTLPEPIPPSLAALFGQHVRLDPRKADEVLGFPRTDDRLGLEAAARWFRDQASRGQAEPAPSTHAETTAA